MSTYTIKTDACMTENEADTMDAAAVEFASDERIGGVTDAASLVAAVEASGGWCWIEDDTTGDRIGSAD